FVGAKPPTLEWLRTSAKPLLVRKERVMKALEWLSEHNHLYKDVFIDRTVFDGHGDLVEVPFHIEHVIPSDGIDATTSSYTQLSSDAPAPFPTDSRLGDDPNTCVVVTDVRGHESPASMRKAAADHLQKPGSNYLGIGHGPNPVNEFDNPDLLPLIYPTLFPYGIGGVEDRSRRTPFGFDAHLKH
ncbi:hypothetical protein K438DRAFT_1468457, partial [Mycena galopus ATCC 62051]